MRTRTQEEGAVTPEDREPDLPVGLSGRGVGRQWPAAGSGLLAAVVLEERCVPRSPPGGDQGLWTPGLGRLGPNDRVGTQPHLSADGWIKDLLSKGTPIRARARIPHSQSLPWGRPHKPHPSPSEGRQRKPVTEN